jgi:hypothetical protein
MLRHDGTRIPDGEPGTRTLMSVSSAVFGTAALPIRLALRNLVLLFRYLLLLVPLLQITQTEAVGLEPTRDILLSGLADQRVYHFRHASTATGAPGFEPEASVLETEMLSGYTTLL